MPKMLIAIPHGTVLPDPAGLPEGYPFRLDPDNVLYTITGGLFIALTGSGGGGGPAFTDDFTRADIQLAGNNGWFNADTPQTAQFSIVGNEVVVPTGASPAFGNSPILHPRNGVDPNIADVTVDLARVDTSGFTGLVVVADATYQYGLAVETDGSNSAPTLDIITGGASGPSTWDTTDSAFAAFTPSGSTTIRMTYDDTTKLLSLYQGGVLRNTVDVQAALDTYYGPGTDFPALSTMPNAGFFGNAGENIETFDNFVCV